MKNFDREDYYEQESLWGHLKDHSDIQEKTDLFLKIIPLDVTCIIDVGCGDGAITNKLAEKFQVVGVDRSREALRHVKTQKILSSSDKIDLPSNSFDLVLSSELLEHLPEEIFYRTIEEFKRLSKKYILLSIPNRESLWIRETKCLQCSHRFHVYYHQRRFDLESIKNFFPEFRVLKTVEMGVQEIEYSRVLTFLKQKIGNYWFWLENLQTVCPRCGNRVFRASAPDLFFKALNSIENVVLRRILKRSHPFWLIVLMEKVSS